MRQNDTGYYAFQVGQAFKPREAGKEHVCFTFHKGHILTGQSKTGSITLPTFEQLPGDFGKLKKKAVYAFSVDDNPMFLLPEQDLEGDVPETLQYREAAQFISGGGKMGNSGRSHGGSPEPLVPGAPLLRVLRKGNGLFR